MTDMNVTQKATGLYIRLLDDLEERLNDGTATPADRKLIRDIAKDHGVQIDTSQPDTPWSHMLPPPDELPQLPEFPLELDDGTLIEPR